MKSICEKCRHRKTCAEPCRPVELYLKQGNPDVFEKRYTNADGKQVTIMFAKSKENPQSFGPEIDEHADPAFSTENDSPFRHFEPSLKQTGIFIDRFFHGFKYADLATKYDCTERDAQQIYLAAVNRLFVVIAEMDKGKQWDRARTLTERRSGSMPKGQRWFLMNKVFDLTPSQIIELEGLDKRSSAVRQEITRVADRLAANELRLIVFTDQEREEAKSRLDKFRARRRRQHRRKKKDQT